MHRIYFKRHLYYNPQIHHFLKAKCKLQFSFKITLVIITQPLGDLRTQVTCVMSKKIRERFSPEFWSNLVRAEFFQRNF